MEYIIFLLLTILVVGSIYGMYFINNYFKDEEKEMDEKKDVHHQDDIYITQDELQSKIEFYVDKIFNNEMKHISILSRDEIKVEAIMMSVDEYECLAKRSREYKQKTESDHLPSQEMFLGIKNDLKSIKEDVRTIAYLK